MASMLNWVDWRLAVAVVALGFALFQFFWNRRNSRKELSYDYSATAIKGFDNSLGGKLQLTFEGEPVTDVSFIKVFLRNSGRKTIEAKDFDGPISITIMSDETLWAVVTDTNRTPLLSRLSVTRDAHLLTINPVMLNSGDEFGISVLARSFRGVLLVGRISDVSEIKQKDAAKPRSLTLFDFLLVASGVSFPVIFLFLGRSTRDMLPVSILLACVLTTIWLFRFRR